MNTVITNLSLTNFKSFQSKQSINLSQLNFLMGANSSGKSTSIQSLLSLKQTSESKKNDISLLLSGKYVTLGTFDEVINNSDNELFSLGFSMKNEAEYTISWSFRKDEQNISGVKLALLDIENLEIKIRISESRESLNEYEVFIDDVKQPYRLTFNNIFFDKIRVQYSYELNSEICDMMKAFLNIAYGQNKMPIMINKDKHISDQYIGLFNDVNDVLTKFVISEEEKEDEEDEDYEEDEDEESKNVSELSDEINTELINKCLDLLSKYIELNDENIDSNILYRPLMLSLRLIYVSKIGQMEYDEKLVDELTSFYEKYSVNYETRIKSNVNKADERTSIREIRFNEYFESRGIRKKASSEEAHSLFISYNNDLKRLLESVRYLGPLRENPRSLYNWNVDTDPEYVGPKGQHFASVLSSYNKKIETYLPNGDLEKVSLVEALNDWCNHLAVASKINIGKENSFGINVIVENTNNVIADIMNVGVGTSQVLPVLIMGLISPENSTLIYEQPELHLHPYSQSRLADFFIAMAKLNKKIIVETHSEYMIQRLRYNLVTGAIDEDDISISFFDNKYSGTEVYDGELNSNGELNYPENFKDNNLALIKELIAATMNK